MCNNVYVHVKCYLHYPEYQYWYRTYILTTQPCAMAVCVSEITWRCRSAIEYVRVREKESLTAKTEDSRHVPAIDSVEHLCTCVNLVTW